MQTDLPIRTWPGTIILQCPPCSWGKCVFCGFSKDCVSGTQPSPQDFLAQFTSYFQKHGVPEHLEIYNSGSFLDDRQISPEARIAIFKELKKRGLRSLTLESRPEYISPETLVPLIAEFKGDLTVAIGIEVADDDILNRLKKGFSLEDVEKAHLVLKEFGLSSRAYLLVGAPFIRDATAASLDSVRWAQKMVFDEISLLAAYPMPGSEGYRLWKTGEWIPIRQDEFERIVGLARKLEPRLDFSSDGLETVSPCL
jgi:radical SAM enzyme (TIGR01210 family)